MAVCVPLNAEIFQMSSAVTPEPQPETLTKGIDLMNKETRLASISCIATWQKAASQVNSKSG